MTPISLDIPSICAGTTDSIALKKALLYRLLQASRATEADASLKKNDNGEFIIEYEDTTYQIRLHQKIIPYRGSLGDDEHYCFTVVGDSPIGSGSYANVYDNTHEIILDEHEQSVLIRKNIPIHQVTKISTGQLTCAETTLVSKSDHDAGDVIAQGMGKECAVARLTRADSHLIDTKNPLLSEDDIGFVTPKAAGLDIQEVDWRTVSLRDTVNFLFTFAQDIEKLHQANWVHLDLNGANGKVNPLQNYRGSVIDFGSAEREDAKPPQTTTLYFNGPLQLIPRQKAHRAMDIWALSLLMFNTLFPQDLLSSGKYYPKQAADAFDSMVTKEGGVLGYFRRTIINPGIELIDLESLDGLQPEQETLRNLLVKIYQGYPDECPQISEIVETLKLCQAKLQHTNVTAITDFAGAGASSSSTTTVNNGASSSSNPSKRFGDGC